MHGLQIHSLGYSYHCGGFGCLLVPILVDSGFVSQVQGQVALLGCLSLGLGYKVCMGRMDECTASFLGCPGVLVRMCARKREGTYDCLCMSLSTCQVGSLAAL